MRTLLTIITLATITLGNVQASTKTANTCFKEQVKLALQNVDSHDFNGNKKALNAGLKSCNDIVKAERLSKKRIKLQEQIKKLQAKLTAN